MSAAISTLVIFSHPPYTNTCLKLSSWTIYNQLITALAVKFPNKRGPGYN